MLTIVGYSINATIVIFDRIRENTKGSRSNLEEIVNESITQTLTRSMYTSFTTFVMVAVLYIMGVSSIREFAAPLMVGVICGAYSSVCITGALWLVMKRYYKKPVAQAVAAKNTAAPAKQNNNSQDTKSGKKNSDQPKKKNRNEMVGIVESVGSKVTHVKPGDRVTVNVETFCGECFFCKKGYVNNCTDENGGWALGCRIDGGQAEYVRVPFADQGLNKIPDGVTDRQALLVGDVLATGYWAARISEITEEDTVLIVGAGPTGICTLLSVMLKNPAKIIICEKDETRIQFINEHYPEILTVSPEDCMEFVKANSEHGGADVVLEVAGAESTFKLAWECARPNAVVTIVALYDKAQTLPLPDMYGKNLTFKTGGVDGCDCEETLKLIAEGKINTEPLITHTYPLERIEEAYELFENKRDGVIKVAVEC